MFWSKKDKSKEQPVNLEGLTIIPDEFYGGANPVVKFKEVEKTVNLDKDLNKPGGLTPEEKAAFEKASVAGGDDLSHPANFLTSRKFLIIGAVGLFVIFILGAGVYYWYQATKQQPTATLPQPKLTPAETPIAPTTTEPILEPTATSSGENISPISTEPAIEFPSKLLGESQDFDNDRVSDVAEEFFKTDPANSDSDGDKYPDGHELYYLYNPIGVEPQKLIDSGLVKSYANPNFGYSLYYPVDWAIGAIDNENREVLFSAVTGESVDVQVFDLTADETFADWFGKMAATEKLSDLTDFSSRFNAVGKKRNDGLVYYFLDGKRIYLLTYRILSSPVVNFKIVLEVMARSFAYGQAQSVFTNEAASGHGEPGTVAPLTSDELLTPPAEETPTE